MATKKLEYKSQEKSIEYRGVVYIVPPRKSSIEMKMREMSTKLSNAFIDWETYKECFEIFFTTEQAEQLTVNQEESNLDELDYILQNVIELYTKEKTEKAEKQMKEQLNKIAPTMQTIEKVQKMSKV